MPMKRIVFDTGFKKLFLGRSRKQALSLEDALRLYCLDAESQHDDNLKAIWQMFPGFSLYQMRVIAFFMEDAYKETMITVSDRYLLTLDESLPAPKKIKDIKRLHFLEVLACKSTGKQVITTDFHLNVDFLEAIVMAETGPIVIKPSSPVGEFIFPESINPERLFYNKDTFESLEDIAECLTATNFDKLMNHYQAEGRNFPFTVLLEGPSGTGKTAFVKEIARRTGRAIFSLDVSKIRASDYGKEEKNLRGCFEEYEYIADMLGYYPIMFLDECDTMIAKRLEASGTNPSLTNLQNTATEIWLQELDKFNGILFLTTNLTSHMDEAIARRLLFQVNIPHPDDDTQAAIWKHFFPGLENSEARQLAKETNFSGGQILQVKRKANIKEILSGGISFVEICRICGTNGKIQKRNPVGFCR